MQSIKNIWYLNQFFFAKRPLDASNTVAMIKLIEDIIFEDDNYKIMDIGGITSRKAKEDYLIITIQERA